MDEFLSVGGANGARGEEGSEHDPEEWAQSLARTVAHLAAQLTVAQVRLRALATTLAEAGLVDADAVAARVRAVAEADAGSILRENLGEALVELIDVDALERDLVAYLAEPGG